MHTSFLLRARGTQLKSQLAGVHLLVQVGHGVGAHILQAVADALQQIRHVAVERSLVNHRAADSVRHACLNRRRSHRHRGRALTFTTAGGHVLSV